MNHERSIIHKKSYLLKAMSYNYRFKNPSQLNKRLLGKIQAKHNFHQQLLRILQTAVPDKLSNHLLYCTDLGNKLTLFTDKSVWASQLRFYQPALLSKLDQHYPNQYQSIQIRILQTETQTIRTKKPVTPGKQSIDLITEASEHQPDDDLKTALKKLACTLKSKSS